mmetsp:Transcript_122280/g.342282  ORF Transcript_122280/g.342282 Transcript_122280/m.342282 type:complete len:216 (+) Transcript_122280:1410-2057(+)
MSRRFSTYKSISSSPPAPAVAALYRSSPRAAFATASEAAWRSPRRALSPCALIKTSTASAMLAAIFGPAIRFFFPSTTQDLETMLQKLRTSSGCAAKRACWQRMSSAMSPLTCLAKLRSPPPRAAWPATMAAASLPDFRPSGAAKWNFSAAAGSSPSGASMSPAFVSSSYTLAACFWAPRPRSPARIFRSFFSMLGWMSFCNFGAPPAAFQAPLA